ncbi:MAG: tyrosine-type recombinase/integrase [Alphaproteobacteria bacterium]
MAARKPKPSKRSTWNKGLEVGPRAAYSKREVTRIRTMLTKRGDSGMRDLALFNTAIDTMLHASDLLSLTVKHVKRRNGVMRDTVEVAMAGTDRTVECTLSKETRKILENWIAKSGKKQGDFLFTGRSRTAKAVTPRQLSRLVKAWTQGIGIDPTDYGTESLRRTRAVHIVSETGNLEAVRVLLGHTKIASTARYLGDFQPSDPLAVSRSHEL